MHTAIVSMEIGNLKVRINDDNWLILLTLDIVGRSFLLKNIQNGICFERNLFKKKRSIHAHKESIFSTATDWHK